MKLLPVTAKVLTAVQLDAQASLAQLSKTSKLPIHVIQYQLLKLRDLGIIRRGVVVNQARLGLQLYQSYLVANTSLYKNYSEIEKYFKKSSSINWYAKLSGEFQIGLSIATSSATKLANFFDKLSNNFSDPVGTKSISQVLNYYVFKKRYLLPTQTVKKSDLIEVNSNVEVLNVDDTDRAVLGALSDYALSTNVEMAKSIGIGRTTFDYRLKKLIDSKVVEAFIYYINSRKLGFLTYRVLVASKGDRSIALDKILAFAQQEKSVTFIIHSLGIWDFEIVVELIEASDIFRVLSNLHLSCHEVILKIQTVSVLEQSTSSAYLKT